MNAHAIAAAAAALAIPQPAISPSQLTLTGDGWTLRATITLVPAPTAGCPANCDASTAAPLLTTADLSCFLALFSAGDHRANCDRSTTLPLLTPADFTCFLQQFAAGCPDRATDHGSDRSAPFAH